MRVMTFVRRSGVAIGVLTTVLWGPGIATASPGSDDAAPPVAAAGGAVVLSPGEPRHALLENLNVFFGPDGSKQPQDLGINANMGVRAAASLGIPLVERAKLGAQIGAAFNYSTNAVHVLDQVEGTDHRTQTFITAGIFERVSPKFNWGLAYDALFEHYYDDFRLGQVRGQVGFGVTASNEIGTWFTRSVQGDSGLMGSTGVRLDPVNQANVYHRHTWANFAQTTAWVGMANGHQNVVWVFPDNSRDRHVLVYGAQLFMPLSDRFAVTGSANLVQPADTGTVDAYLGISFFPGRSALRASRGVYTPLASIANNPEMAVDLRR